MKNNDSLKQTLLIGNIARDIINIEKHIPNIIQPSIKEKKLTYKRKIKNKKVIEYEDGTQINVLENKLKMQNGEIFEGIMGKKLKESYLKKGVYIWPSGIKYLGNFNVKNTFEGFGKINFNDNCVFESEFKNGFPNKNGKLKKKMEDGANLYIQSNFKNNQKSDKIIFDDKTIIEIKKKNERIFYFLGNFKNGKLMGEIFANKKIDNNRFIEIRGYFKEGKMHGLMKAKDVNPKNTFLYMGEYKYGHKDGFFKIKDTVKNIIINEEFHDIQSGILNLKSYFSIQKKKIIEFLIKLYKNKMKDIKYEKICNAIKKILKMYLKKSVDKLFSSMNQYKYLFLFNKKYKTNYNLDAKIIHLNKIKLGTEGFNLLCKIHFLNLKELSLIETNTNDFSSIKSAIFPNLKALSLGNNSISSINFINSLPFPKLEDLMLGVNIISDISPLNIYNSNTIKALFLLDNKISDITPLKNMNTPNLEELYVGQNITDISPLVNCKFPKLKQLSLNNNKIKMISSIKDFKFPNLELLILSNNQIEKIDSLIKAKFPKLNSISLNNNLISNSTILSKLPLSFQNLKKLDISKNKFIVNTDDFSIIIYSLKKKIKNLNY